eukprot:GHUV01052953.1.p1 GENE.GHUV01052953.1~~GHUV01052953.1.p1  ORF type:complete len:187 (-),score=36.15 GHUV01052953.1:167-661(-)
MAMDALPAAASGPRARLMTNIGLAFVQLGQYADAAGAFETAINLAPDHQVCKLINPVPFTCCMRHCIQKQCMASIGAVVQLHDAIELGAFQVVSSNRRRQVVKSCVCAFVTALVLNLGIKQAAPSACSCCVVLKWACSHTLQLEASSCSSSAGVSASSEYTETV